MIYKPDHITSQNNSENFANISLWGWCLFDFANSIAAVIGGIYFSKWFIQDIGASSISLNILFFSSALFIMLTGKLVGRKIDIQGYKFWIILSSAIAFFSILMLFLGALFLPSSCLISFSFFMFLTFLFGYQISRICHNTYLRSVIPELIQSKMSGYGAAANWAGSIIGIIITIPVITIYPNIFGRELTFLVAALAYGILTPVSLFFMFISGAHSNVPLSNEDYINLRWHTLLFTIGSSLLIYFLLFDVMATVERNLPTYLIKVFAMPDDVQAIGFLIVLLFAMVGGLIAAKQVNSINSTFWLKLCSFTLAFSIIMITLKNSLLLWIAFVLAGSSYGILESAIRVNFMSTFSSESAGEHFGILAVVERTSGVVGPLFWIIPFMFLINDVHSYIVSMLLMAALSLIAFTLLFFHRSNQRNRYYILQKT